MAVAVWIWSAASRASSAKKNWGPVWSCGGGSHVEDDWVMTDIGTG